MRSGSFSYLFKQGSSSLLKNRLMTFASIGALTACLFLVGICMLLSLNIDSLIRYAEQQNEVVVFLDDGVTKNQIDEIGREIDKLGNVSSREFVSKDAALEEQKALLGDTGNILEGLEDDNPLPDSYRIKLTDHTRLSENVETLSKIPGVLEVNAPSDLAATLSSLRQTIMYLGIILVIVLITVTMVVIGNTIKLTVFARRTEISIMKHVGATDAFVRFPFLVEGFLLGLIAAALSFILVWVGYEYVYALATAESNNFLGNLVGHVLPFSKVWWLVAGVFAFIGINTGLTSTSIAVRHHLEV